MQLLRMMNKLLDRHPESRQRMLAWSAPTVVPVWPQVSLILKPKTPKTLNQNTGRCLLLNTGVPHRGDVLRIIQDLLYMRLSGLFK